MMRSLAIVLTLILLSILFSGCSHAPNQGINNKTFIDDTGVDVTLPSHIERIVSLAPSETEIVASLGDLPRLVGRTDYCDYPPSVKEAPSIGGPQTFSVESIVSLHPDVILASPLADKAKIDELRSLNYAVIVFQSKSIDDIYRNIAAVGDILERKSTADELIQILRSGEEKVSSAINHSNVVRVLYVVWDNPLYVAANQTFEDDLIRKSGGRNVMDDTNGYIVASDESIVARSPDVIIVCTEHTVGLAKLKDRIIERPSFAQIPAIVNGRICEVNADLANRPGPRVIQALESFSACIKG